jgi:hypothetical protein
MRIWFVLVAACHAASPHPVDLAARAAPALNALDPVRVETDTKYLASDELEGRAPGTPGGAKAEQYIAERYKQIGLQPGGEHGTYFQTVPLRQATVTSATVAAHTQHGDVVLDPAKEVFVRGYPRSAHVAIDAPLVFVGYGMAREDLGYDDLSGLELHGSIAVIFSGAPRTTAGKPVDPALHASLAEIGPRTRALRDHGASAVLVIYDPARARVAPWHMIFQKSPRIGSAWLEGGVPASDPVIPAVTIDTDAFDRIMGAPAAMALWQQLDHGERAHLAIAASLTLHVESELSDVVARNVVGVLPGGDLAREDVLYTAHHDHLGIGTPVNGDAIYNGALDNAIGVAEMLEIARAMKALPHPPRRSVMFVAVTAEERGLLGSDFFIEHPTVPRERIVGDINLDGGTPDYQVYDVVALGSEHSSLGATAAVAARTVGLTLSPDPEPDQVLFIRSDQYSFVKRGIPSLFASVGYMDAHGHTETNRALSDAWMETHYHQPSDQWESSYRGAYTLPELRFELVVGLAVADADTRPAWNTGDVFAGVAKPATRRDSPQPVSPAVDGSAKPR